MRLRHSSLSPLGPTLPVPHPRLRFSSLPLCRSSTHAGIGRRHLTLTSPCFSLAFRIPFGATAGLDRALNPAGRSANALGETKACCNIVASSSIAIDLLGHLYV